MKQVQTFPAFLSRQGRAPFGAAFAAIVLAASASASMAQKSTITVDWKDPEIKRFVEEQKSQPAATARLLFDKNLTKLKLPVIGLGQTPSSVQRSFAVAPRGKPTVILDPDNPVWYSLTYQFGQDIKVTIEADLRVQQKLPPGTKLYKDDKGIDPDTKISVFDSTSEVGMTGAIAEFKVYKFGNIPYTVTVECTEKAVATCRDTAALRKDKDLLRIISARPPIE